MKKDNSILIKLVFLASILCSLGFITNCKPEVEIQKYTVIFELNGGTFDNPESIIVNSGDLVTKPTAPQKTDYTFEGWYTDIEFSTPFDFNTPVTKNLTLYAKWKIITIQPQIEITVKTDFSELQVEQSKNNARIKFTVKGVYDTYKWYLDDILVSKSSDCLLYFQNYPPDTYELYLETVKNSMNYSYFAHITINE